VFHSRLCGFSLQDFKMFSIIVFVRHEAAWQLKDAHFCPENNRINALSINVLYELAPTLDSVVLWKNRNLKGGQACPSNTRADRPLLRSHLKCLVQFTT